MSRKDGRKAVETGQILPFPVAVKRAGISPDDVQDVSLCPNGGGFVYRVKVVQRGGAPRMVAIPAN